LGSTSCFEDIDGKFSLTNSDNQTKNPKESSKDLAVET
jgi:hypothetical protein